MQLRSVKYSEFENSVQEWKIEGLSLSDKNLIVGENASGKSRALNIINALSQHVAGIKKPASSGTFDIEFIQNEVAIRYQLEFVEEAVVKEVFEVGGRVFLDRGEGGIGKIWAEEIGKNIKFQTPTSEIAAVNRRDEIQHPFLEQLYSWGATLHHYQFGTYLGKDHLAVLTGKGKKEINTRNTNEVINLYLHAGKKIQRKLNAAVINDMRQVDYYLEEIGLKPPVSISVTGLPGELIGLYVKEADLPGITDQHSMSQGMFRVLSLLIQINYLQLAKIPSCILVDDIGEGLDFRRSCQLIDLLREKTENLNIQLILSTNDRFVMNRVPLEEWSVLRRQGNYVKVLNYGNSQELFEEFKFTGLSNFSFLEMDFANGTPSEDIETDE